MITSPDNPLVKKLKKLNTKKGRDETRLFLIEGKRFVDEAIRINAFENVIVTEKFYDDLSGSLNGISESRIIIVTDKIMKSIATTETPPGILAVCPFIDKPPEELLDVPDKGFYVALDRVSDPGNIGTLIRSAHAFNASGIFLSKDCADIYNPKTVRATAGSIFYVPLSRNALLETVINKCRALEIKVLALQQESQKPLSSIKFDSPVLILIGSETGLDDNLRNLADETAFIPMPGKSESLNLSVAGSIAFYELARLAK